MTVPDDRQPATPPSSTRSVQDEHDESQRAEDHPEDEADNDNGNDDRSEGFHHGPCREACLYLLGSTPISSG